MTPAEIADELRAVDSLLRSFQGEEARRRLAGLIERLERAQEVAAK